MTLHLSKLVVECSMYDGLFAKFCFWTAFLPQL